MTARRETKEKVMIADTESGQPSAAQVHRPGLGDDHPLNDIIGTYEGPVWERILKNIKRNRKIADREARIEGE